MLLSELLTRQYLLFLLLGGSSALVNILIRYILSDDLSYSYAIIVAYLISTSMAFLLNTLITFNVHDSFLNRLQKYFFVNVIGLLQVLLISSFLLYILERLLPFSEEILETFAHILALATLAITSFFLHKKFTFKLRARD